MSKQIQEQYCPNRTGTTKAQRFHAHLSSHPEVADAEVRACDVELVKSAGKALLHGGEPEGKPDLSLEIAAQLAQNEAFMLENTCPDAA